MEIFHNRDEPNYYTIRDYGPRWFTEFLEMDANLRYAGWTLDLSAYFLSRILSNLFPEYADERTIRMLERILHIEYDKPDVSMDERRRTVMMYFYGIGKLNRTSIKDMVRIYSGRECTTVWNGSYLIVTALAEKDDEDLYLKLYEVLRRRMPAHLGIGVVVSIRRIFRQRINISQGGAVGAGFKIQPIIEDRASAMSLYVGYASSLKLNMGGGYPNTRRGSTGHMDRAGGVYYHTRIKSKLIG